MNITIPVTPGRKLGPAPGEKRVFQTQHSTQENQAIAEAGLILLTEVGSTMHGVSTPTNGDDIDEMGICIEPPSHVIGLSHFEQYEFRTNPVNVRSGAGDIDRCVYSLRKWARLASAGNPTVLMPLFVPSDMVRYANNSSLLLRAHKHLFLSKLCGERFLGYLEGQRERYLDVNRVDSTHASRPELIAKYGWDTKTGYHALRLAVQGKELMDTGHITLPMRSNDREFLLSVRNGALSKESVTLLLDERYIPALKEATEQSFLPDAPDYQAIDRFLATTYQDFWEEHEDYVSIMKGKS